MSQSDLIVFYDLAQRFRRGAVKLTELSEQPAQTLKTASQQTQTFLLAHLRKGKAQIDLTRAPQLPRDPVGNSAQGAPNSNGRRARQKSEEPKIKRAKAYSSEVCSFPCFAITSKVKSA